MSNGTQGGNHTRNEGHPEVVVTRHTERPAFVIILIVLLVIVIGYWLVTNWSKIAAPWQGLSAVQTADDIFANATIADPKDRARKIITEDRLLDAQKRDTDEAVAVVDKYFSSPSLEDITPEQETPAGEPAQGTNLPAPPAFLPLSETTLAGAPSGPINSQEWGVPIGCDDSTEETIGIRNWTLCVQGVKGVPQPALVALAIQLYGRYARPDGTPTQTTGEDQFDNRSITWKILPR